MATEGFGLEGDRGDGQAGSTPRVRTLLLTDLCDSTLLVERLGDAAAAELFREHDRLVLGLQQRWRGRLIDRSDGLLLLFERAIDGLGFALDYARGLRAIGERRQLARLGVELRARSGLHVGEVLTWRNSDDAVSHGAKPLEVEGLAKPMAGRLMTLARPGQILLSATAEPLAHRAARELGERGEQLLWKSWGRWRFKGVPQGQEVHEVGEPGIAPLRPPRQDRGKAWRDIPLWRRPSALAAELLLVAGLVAGGWFLARPQPAIAFAERDWVVVADLRNLTGDAQLDDSLEQAFRISLEQSRYVNILSDLKARDTLVQMRREPDTELDRTVASEIALRDGARAVILPTVAEIGGRVRVSAEVIDPHTQATVYAESADGTGAASTLRSIDKVTAALRGRLGEAIQSIEKNSIELPNATTSNLDALKAYAIGRRYMGTGDAPRAQGFLERAVKLDPAFALGWVALGVLQAHVVGDFEAASRYYARATALRDRLPPRDALKLDVAVARIESPATAIARLEQLLELYPDEFASHIVMAQLQMWDRNNPEAALRHARAAMKPQARSPGIGHYMQGIALVALERPADAIAEFKRASALGYDGPQYSRAFAHAAQRQWDQVDRLLGEMRVEGPLAQARHAQHQALFAADRGDWEQALAHAATATRIATEADPVVASVESRILELAVAVTAGRRPRSDMLAAIRNELAVLHDRRAEIDAQLPRLRMSGVQALCYMAARLDDAALVETCTRRVDAMPGIAGFPVAGQVQAVLAAELERIRRSPGEATQRLRELAADDTALVLVHSTLRRSALATGDAAEATAQERWLGRHRGRAYVERPADGMLAVFSVVDSTPDR